MATFDNSLMTQLLESAGSDANLLSKIFTYVDQHAEDITPERIATLQALLDRAVEFELTQHSKQSTIFERLNQLIEHVKHNEQQLTNVLHLLYQTLSTLQQHEVPASSNIMQDLDWLDSLLELIFNTSHSRTLIANILGCLQLYVRHFEDRNFAADLWDHVTKAPTSAAALQTLVQLFDEFMVNVENFADDPELIALIRKLLKAEERELRKIGYYLLKKRAPATPTDPCWTVYISTMENLEENQSHLILPSLESLNSVQWESEQWQDWLPILYHKILSHQNVLVTRWALEYFLKRFVCKSISSELLLQFFTASNDTSFYNAEGYDLPTRNIENFLQDDCWRVCTIIGRINWKPVPLNFWLTHLEFAKQQASEDSGSKESLLNLAARVRVLQNPLIRGQTIELLERIFARTIANLSLAEYVVLIETLYNVADEFCHFETLATKMEDAAAEGQKLALTQRVYDILSNHVEWQSQSGRLQRCAINVPKNQQSWLHFLVIFNYEDVTAREKICSLHYGLNLEDMQPDSLIGFTNELTQKLAQHKNEELFVRKKAIDLFADQFLQHFDDLAKYNLQMTELINMGSAQTLLKTSQLLATYESEVNAAILDAVVNELKKYTKKETLCYDISSNVLKHCRCRETPETAQHYAKALLEFDLENLAVCTAVLESEIELELNDYVRGIMLGNARSGDARTEEIYSQKLFPNMPSLQDIRYLYATHVPQSLRFEFIGELVKINNHISSKKPRYFENSTEHRLKLRIVAALLHNIPHEEHFWSEELLKALLYYNNQLNVNYFYEIITAKCIQDFSILRTHLNMMEQYSPSLQVSLISITYCYCILNWETTNEAMLQAIIDIFVPLTMGPNFQTRLYSQLVLFRLLSKIQETLEIDIENCSSLRTAICAAVGPSLPDFLHDARLRLPYIYLETNASEFFNAVMYISNAPVDEYASDLDYSRYEKTRLLFTKKISNVAKQTTLETIEMQPIPSTSGNVQRKMNPTSEICTIPTVTSCSESMPESEMIVVASLIDKLPNLGGIARTCEVLGIKNLVLSSMKHTEKSDFKNLSMTAESALNLVAVPARGLPQFLLHKISEGYQVVGAEQTANSCSFVNFKFPKKCILLLGHEKEGIPGNLLSFLDYAVEIPQFGVVRSLNVHVTGALFMWEYCKQHIVGNSTQ